MKKSGFIIAVACFMAVIMMCGPSKMVALAEAEAKTYISDIRIGYDQDKGSAGSSRAKNALINQGYTVVNSDLNSGTGKGWAYFGYKTTNNKDEAITDMKIMDMEGGYKLNNYYNTLSYYKASVSERAKGLVDAANEFRANIEKKSPAAFLGFKNLNYLVVKKQNNIPLGDYLLSTDRTEQEFYDIVLKCDPNILTYILNQFVLGVADYGTDTWLERLSNFDSESIELTDEEYYNRTETIYPTIKKIAESYAESEDALADVSKLSDEKKCEYSLTSTIYEMLNEKEFDGTPIGDMLANEFIFENELYPLVHVLTKGQLAMLSMTGVNSIASVLTMNTEQSDSAFAMANQQIEKYANDIKGMDLWSNIVENVMKDKEVAVTDAANRRMVSQNKLDELARTDETKENMDKALQIVGGIAGAAFAVVSIAWGVMSTTFGATFSISLLAPTISAVWSVSVGGMFASGIFTGGIVILALAVIALIAIAIYYIYDAIKKLIEYNNPKFTDIPLDMYDYFEKIPDPDSPEETVSKYIGYSVALDQDGKPADLNTWQGLKWNAIYYTKDVSAGSPILAPSAGENMNDYFQVKMGDNSIPQGFSALAKFGDKVAFNTNTHAKSDYSNGVFFFFRRLNSEINTVTGKYISDIMVYEADKEETVLAFFNTKDDFYTLKYNLISNTGKFAMIGYKLTSNKSNAIRDIRIAVNYNVSQTYIGEASFTSCGTYQNTTLYYTKSDAAGDPIYADFVAKYNIDDKPSGQYQPISLLSGGPAANMAIGSTPVKRNNTYYPPSLSSLNKIFLYYKSSVDYSTGPDYVSGIAFFNSASTGPANELMHESGYKSLNQDMTNKSNNHTLMAVATTKNPKRALRRIYTFYADSTKVTMPTCTTYGGLGYVATTTYVANKSTLVLPNAIIPISTSKISIENKNSYISINGNNTMYVTSATSAGTPFTVEQIKLSANQLSANQLSSGYYAVSNLMDSSYSAADIKRGNKSEEFLYMYLPGQHEVLGKYVKSIVVSGSKDGAAYSNLGLFNSGAEQAQKNALNGFYYSKSDKDYYSNYYSSTGEIKTNDQNLAITDIKLVMIEEDKNKPDLSNKLTINGFTYTLASKTPFGFSSLEYYMPQFGLEQFYCGGVYVYTTTNPGAGEPITEIVTAGNTDTMWGYEQAGYYYGVQNNQDVEENNQYVKMFFKRNSENKYIRAVDANYSPRKLMFSGINNIVDFDLNTDTGGDYVCVGYNYTSNDKYAIRDLISYVSNDGNRPSQLTYHGIIYKACATGADFNKGAGGPYI